MIRMHRGPDLAQYCQPMTFGDCTRCAANDLPIPKLVSINGKYVCLSCCELAKPKRGVYSTTGQLRGPDIDVTDARAKLDNTARRDIIKQGQAALETHGLLKRVVAPALAAKYGVSIGTITRMVGLSRNKEL